MFVEKKGLQKYDLAFGGPSAIKIEDKKTIKHESKTPVKQRSNLLLQQSREPSDKSPLVIGITGKNTFSNNINIIQ
jgi:hypothetical protein